MNKYKNEISLGIFTLIAAGLLGFMTLTVGKFHLGPERGVKAVFENASGVVKGTSVMVAGVEVGHIKKIDLENNKAVLNIVLNDDVKISKNVKAQIRAKSLLGEKYVEFVPEKSDSFLESGDIITNTVTPVELDQFVTTLWPVIKKIEPVLEKIDTNDISVIFKTFANSIKGKEENLSRIIVNVDQMTRFFSKNESRLNRIMVNIDSITDETRALVKSNKSSINRIVNNTDKIMNNFGQRSDQLAKRIDVITENLQIVSTDFKNNSPELIKKVDTITSDLRVITGDFRKNSPNLAKKLNTVTENLDSLLISLNKDAPDLAKDLGVITKDLSKLSGSLSKRGPKMVENTDELLVKLLGTLQRLEPLMARLEKFDDKKIIKEVERVMRQVGMKVTLF